MSETYPSDITRDDLESPDNPVDPATAETEQSGMSAAAAALWDECQRVADGIGALGFGFDMLSVKNRSETAALCQLLVNKGLLSEDELRCETYAAAHEILANTLQSCEETLARMPPEQRAQHQAAVAARIAQTPAPTDKQQKPNIQVVRASDQLLIARR